MLFYFTDYCFSLLAVSFIPIGELCTQKSVHTLQLYVAYWFGLSIVLKSSLQKRANKYVLVKDFQISIYLSIYWISYATIRIAYVVVANGISTTFETTQRLWCERFFNVFVGILCRLCSKYIYSCMKRMKERNRLVRFLPYIIHSTHIDISGWFWWLDEYIKRGCHPHAIWDGKWQQQNNERKKSHNKRISGICMFKLTLIALRFLHLPLLLRSIIISISLCLFAAIHTRHYSLQHISHCIDERAPKRIHWIHNAMQNAWILCSAMYMINMMMYTNASTSQSN